MFINRLVIAEDMSYLCLLYEVQNYQLTSVAIVYAEKVYALTEINLAYMRVFHGITPSLHPDGTEPDLFLNHSYLMLTFPFFD